MNHLKKRPHNKKENCRTERRQQCWPERRLSAGKETVSQEGDWSVQARLECAGQTGVCRPDRRLLKRKMMKSSSKLLILLLSLLKFIPFSFKGLDE